MDEVLTPGSEQPGSDEADKNIHDDGKKHPGISDGKLIGGLIGGTAALTAAAVGGAHLYHEHIGRPVNEAVLVAPESQSQEARIAGFNQGGVKFEMTPEGNVQITLPRELIKELDDWGGKTLDATVKNPNGSSENVHVVDEGYRGMGNYSTTVSTAAKTPNGATSTEQQNPPNWREMTASPQPGGTPATLEIDIDGTKGPHSEYTIVEPSPPAPTG